MGAGLLTFVCSDLEAVVEVNQGQRALSLADVGVQAARRQLRSDEQPGRYDANAAVEGFVVASGDMTFRGSVSPSTVSLTTRPGLCGVRLWSWRELYE